MAGVATPLLTNVQQLIVKAGQWGPRWVKLARFVPDKASYLFGRVSCPHYFFETLSWVAFNVTTGAPIFSPGVAFQGLGFLIMLCYACDRHDKYCARFDGRKGQALYPAFRTPMIPGINLRPPQALIEALA